MMKLAALLCGGAVLTANAAELPDDLGYFQEFPRVLSASRLAQPLSEAPNAMTVINRDMIVASGARTVTDLLKLVPGMYVSYYKGSQGFAAYHGATDQYSRRMQVLIDGRSVYLPPLSSVEWADIPLNVGDIERIEVIRGPAAASYGANSTQGVISITTRDAASASGRQIDYTHGTHGIKDASVRFGANGELYDYRMTLAYTADNGYTDLTELPAQVPLTLVNQNALLRNNHDSNQARLLNYRANYHPNAVDSFDFQFGFSHDIQGVGFVDKNPYPVNPYRLPGDTATTNGNMPHDLISNSGFVQLDWIHALAGEDELRMRYYHLRLDQHEALTVYLGGILFSDPVLQSMQSGRDEIEVQHTLALSERNRLVYGAAWRQDELDARGHASVFAWLSLPVDYASQMRSDEWRIFVHDEWRPTNMLLVNSGAMFEHDRMGHEKVSPRASLNLHVTPQQTLRLGSSIAYRTPSMVETNFPPISPGVLIVPNVNVMSPGLLPERLLSREIGYLGEFPQQGMSLDLRLFSDQLRDGIYKSHLTNTGKNGASSDIDGIEMTFKYRPDSRGELTVNAAHILARSNGPAMFAAGENAFSSVDTSRYNDIVTGSMPMNSASALYARHLNGGWSFSGAFYYQDELQPMDRPLIDYQPAQRRVDVRAAKTFRAGGRSQGEVALIVQNLFGTDYTEYVANNVFDRHVFATLTLQW
jgi:iron complex outermembrane receptor protein